MKRKWIIAFILPTLVLLAVLFAVFSIGSGSAAAQAMPTATPAPLVTPVTSAGAINGAGAMGCPMMGGGMAGMPSTSGTTGAGMGGMMGMNTMQGMNMQSMPMQGMAMGNMTGMNSMSDRYVILTDPTTWLAANPWVLIGWIVLFVILLTIFAAFVLGVFFLARRIGQNRPAPKA